ncbi:MAG: hypothetical protein K8F52_14780 [Candidatus Scalindua rubra]|nr:hypothetical protein [Candidatus Scalindua rubra]
MAISDMMIWNTHRPSFLHEFPNSADIGFVVSVEAFVLFYDANAVRKRVIIDLYAIRFKILNTQIPTRFDVTNDRKSVFIGQKIQYIDNIINDLQDLKSGAFAPLSNSPVLIAVLAPLGGLGSIAILQYLPQLLNK